MNVRSIGLARVFSDDERRAHALTIDLLESDQSMLAALASTLTIFPTMDPTPTLLIGQWRKEELRSLTIAIFAGRTVTHFGDQAIIRTIGFPIMLGGPQ